MGCTKTETFFTQQQKEIIDGLMLGDGGLRIKKSESGRWSWDNPEVSDWEIVYYNGEAGPYCLSSIGSDEGAGWDSEAEVVVAVSEVIPKPQE